MGAEKSKGNHGALKSSAHRRMLENDYASQRLSTFTAGREQTTPADHFTLGAKKLDRKGIKQFLSLSHIFQLSDETVLQEEDQDDGLLGGDAGHTADGTWDNTHADEGDRRILLDEDVMLTLHGGQLYTHVQCNSDE